MNESAVNGAPDALRTCAFCPNTCRASYPQGAAVQIESQTPSALCLLALALLNGQLPDDAGARAALGRRDAALAARGRCTYGLDIVSALDAAAARLSAAKA